MPEQEPHTSLDAASLQTVGIDPDTVQARERPVRCWGCGNRTFNLMGGCDQHYQPMPARPQRQG